MKNLNFSFSRKISLGIALLVILGLGAWGFSQAYASDNTAPAAQPSPIHPTFALLDLNGENVLDSGAPVSTMQTCGQCHDTAFVESHSFHADLGLADYGTPGTAGSGAAWDTSNGLFGEFDPLTYRYLSPLGDERLDLTTPEWLMVFGARVPGGGPAVTSRTGQPLSSLAPDASNPETSLRNPATGEMESWNWAESGVMEMNCFLCHTVSPNNEARIEQITSGAFGQASTATLLGTGVVEASDDGFAYNASAFDANGELKKEFVQIQDPTNENCAQCHGVVHTGEEDALVVDACDLDQPQTATTGQVISASRINASGLNLADKSSLARSWDVHAERALNCTDCHYSLNNPEHYNPDTDEAPAHLEYDPRRLEIGEYLQRPEHNFARGESAQTNLAPELKGTMRRCESCHAAEKTHADWLPYTARHMEVVSCETCHVPQMYAPAIEAYDWTVIQPSGAALSSCRGIEGDSTVTGLVTGFQPVLMSRTNVDGDALLAPYNLITSWFWVYGEGENTRPVSQADLQAAYLENGAYAPAIVAAFDANGDGSLQESELVIDSSAKEAAVAARLEALGLVSPRITGQVQPYSINHNVARGEAVVSDCQTCHTDDSRLSAPIQLSSYTPGGVLPEFVSNTNVNASGQIYSEDGILFYQPQTMEDNIYVFGHNRVSWIDWVGALAFLGVLGGVGGHGTLRFLAARKRPKGPVETKAVYMYDAYERFWHWLQTFTIVLLLLTGLIIHRPDMFGAFAFRYMVTVHNALAAVLVLNAALSLFWHLVSGEIRQFIPRPYGFFDSAIVQAKFYLEGIFKGGAHPFEKTRQKKLNPLQQMTYFGLLNVLLPLQIITGALMWGMQTWPQVAGALGGLPVLAPFHSLVAWLFASFIVAHVYLTTTGATVLEDIKAMITGWENVEVHPHEEAPAVPADPTPLGENA